MQAQVESDKVSEPLHILLIGNNPMDLGSVMEKLKQVRGQRIITEIAFDLKSIIERLIRFRPQFIFIDDNMGRPGLLETVNTLSSNRWTKNIPIAVLKNSNYHESLGASSILDYLLKQNVSPEDLYKTVRNTIRLRKKQLLLYQAYKKRKGQLMGLIRQ